jgi:cyclohexadienyl dehydratase
VNRSARVAGAGLVCLLALAVACTPPRPAAKTLRVGTSGDYAPFSFKDEAGWDGFDLYVARKFAQDTGRNIELVEFRWPALEIDLQAKKFDVAMSGVTMRPWRALFGTFTRPMVRVGAVVVLKPGVATTLHELDVPSRRVGVNAGGYLEKLARRLFRRAEIVPIPDNRVLAKELREGRVDALMSDELEAVLFRRMVPDAVLLGPLTNDRKAYLVGDPALADELDAWLRAREVDGSLAGLRAKLLGPAWGAPHTAAASDFDALLAAIELRLAFMPAVALAKEQRGLPTEDAAQEAQVIARARERAVLLGVSPDAIAALFEAMFVAARHAQDAYRVLPAGARPPVEAMDLDTQARPALASISATIVARAADLSHDTIGPVRFAPAVLADALDPSLATPKDHLAIATAVVALLPAH